eukprot:scaffold4403_cov164-Skeletonema_dohrnii-CCMP3373.AAC.4
MTNHHGSLEAVDRHIDSVRYDMVLECRAGGRLRCLIRSPTTLQRRHSSNSRDSSLSRHKHGFLG